MEPENVEVTVSIPETPDIVVPPEPAPLVVVVEETQEKSDNTVLSEVIDLAVADVEKDMRIAELEEQVAELRQATLITAEAAQVAITTATDTAIAVEEANDPISTSADDEAPRREHAFWRPMGHN